MSDKARRSNAWDDQHLRGPVLYPVRLVVKALSSISLAVCLLSLTVLYGISASVPVGLLVLAPTYLLYGLSAVLVAGGVTIPAFVGVRRLTRNTQRPARFIATFVVLLVGIMGGLALWRMFVWPQLRYDPTTQEGFRLFAGFVERYKNITLRRLPGIEMSELEYYAWWPLRVILLTFVVNMVFATVRRIDFTVRNIGVLTVHTGIVVLALGSVYYAGLKQEGDTLLLAGAIDPRTGNPSVGPPQDMFYDNTRVALFVNAGNEGWEQHPLHDIPRYNNYNVGATSGASAWATGKLKQPGAEETERELSLPVAPIPNSSIPPDVSLRVVGYAAYAEPGTDWVKGTTGQGDPLRFVYLHSQLPDDEGHISDDPIYTVFFPPRSPADRITGNDVFSLEYTLGAGAGMTPQRWKDLTETLPPRTMHALVVEVPQPPPGTSFRAVYPVQIGSALTIGDTGFRIGVKQLEPTPPFPIITDGYRGATSSVAVVSITPPNGEAYDRYVYHRFPEINQDLLKELKPNGQPVRRDADPSIRVSLIEADQLYVYMDEPGSDGTTRAIVRQKGGAVKVIDSIAPGSRFEVLDKVSLRIGERWPSAVKFERPRPVPPEEQKKDEVGTHQHSMLAVEAATTIGGRPYTQVVWLPFSRYMGVMASNQRRIDLPDGRSLDLMFGRLQRPLPGFQVRLLDFEMIAYDHRGAPRDYQSIVRVVPTGAPGTARFEMFDHVTKLNSPLQAPFHWDDQRNWLTNLPERLVAGMSPFQFKFSQAGWDQQGWARTQAQVDAGQAKRPIASFTILQVGNNPGIHLIAAGGIMMGLGIPWAFYLKPWLVRREKRRIQEAVAAGTWKPPHK